MQAPATPVRERIDAFHNELLVIITLITLFVLGLLLYVMVRFNAQTHPVPTPHHAQHVARGAVDGGAGADPGHRSRSRPSSCCTTWTGRRTPDMTLKVTGHQWYWTYEYPDQGNFSFDSNLIRRQGSEAGGKPRLLDVDNPLVVPVGDRTSASRSPAPTSSTAGSCRRSGVQEYAVVGRLNETWFKVDATGHLLRRVQPDLRRQPRLHADRGQGGHRRPISTNGSPRRRRNSPRNDRRRTRPSVAAADRRRRPSRRWPATDREEVSRWHTTAHAPLTPTHGARHAGLLRRAGSARPTTRTSARSI